MFGSIESEGADGLSVDPVRVDHAARRDLRPVVVHRLPEPRLPRLDLADARVLLPAGDHDHVCDRPELVPRAEGVGTPAVRGRPPRRLRRDRRWPKVAISLEGVAESRAPSGDAGQPSSRTCSETGIARSRA